MNDLLSWAAGLGTIPKVLASIIVILVAAFVLVVLWSPKPRSTTTGQSSTHPNDASSPAAEDRNGSAERPGPISDISWNFDHQEKGQVYFLGLAGGGGYESRVISFQATGRNNLDEPILHARGLIRSDVTNTEFPVFFVIDGVRVAPEDTNGIPRKTGFTIASAPFPPRLPPRKGDPEGMPISRFVIDFAEFTFIFEYDGKKFVRHFATEEVRQQIAQFEAATAPKRPPGVTRRTSP